MSDQIACVRFTGVDGKAQQIFGHLGDAVFDEETGDARFDLTPLTESVTWSIDLNTIDPRVLDLLFGQFVPDDREPPFPDPEDHLEDDPRW